MDWRYRFVALMWCWGCCRSGVHDKADDAAFDRNHLVLLKLLADDVARALDTTRLRELVEDLSEREMEMRRQALHDPLTGLANRALFTDHLEDALARQHRQRKTIAVAMLDVDDFKQVNDTYGHAAGDQLLTALARRLLGTLRASDTSARLGGDEFALILEDLADAGQVQLILGRIRAALEEAVVISGQTLAPRVSLGMAISQDDSTANRLVEAADAAMYEDKRLRKQMLIQRAAAS
jgi:diguanylate cyclase (GGDEF)-like protein